MGRAVEGTKGFKAWTLPSKGSKTSGEEELLPEGGLGSSAQMACTIHVCAPSLLWKEQALRLGEWEGFVEEKGAPLYLLFEGSPHNPLGGADIW